MGTSERLIAGAMSGTSADGVDVAIVRVEGRGLEMAATLVHHHHRAYSDVLKQSIFAARGGGSMSLAELARLGREISLAYATTVNEALSAAGLQADNLTTVAAHGQTLFHDPPNTIQWLDPALVAAKVGCPVVSDFRRADCAAGGQGAPLVPFADYLLFRHPTQNRALANIGGIANVTLLPAGCALNEVVAFDTGPGNCISDHLVRQFDPNGPGFDAGGKIAQRGSIDRAMQTALEVEPYFNRNPPKSTDGPMMIELFQRAMKSAGLSPSLENLLATAAWLTGWSILHAMRSFEGEIILSGGGTHNRCIMAILEQSGRTIKTTDQLGVVSQAKEAIAFALLGAATLDGVPSNVPSATGAGRAAVLGSITPRPI